MIIESDVALHLVTELHPGPGRRPRSARRPSLDEVPCEHDVMVGITVRYAMCMCV